MRTASTVSLSADDPRRTITVMLRAICAALLACVVLVVNVPAQRTDPRSHWPCSGKVDPSFIRTAEATGGKVLLFTPSEVSGAASELSASTNHDQTVLRAASQLDEGVREFQLSLDSTIESAYFFLALQCLESATVMQPSGEPIGVDAPNVSHHAFEAMRLFTIKAPTPGTWRVTIAGRGFYSVIVKARTELALENVSLLRDGMPISGLAPLGETVKLEVSTTRDIQQPDFQLISLAAETLQTLTLQLEQDVDTRKTYAAEVTLPTSEFRILMSGIDERGFAVQRVTPRLFIADR